MKRYFVKRGGFANVYSLMWAETPEQMAALPKDAEHITREIAIEMCVEERERRRNDPDFAYYADTYIFPADFTEQEFMDFYQHPSHYTTTYVVSRLENP